MDECLPCCEGSPVEYISLWTLSVTDGVHTFAMAFNVIGHASLY